jgi:hypothetical protein
VPRPELPPDTPVDPASSQATAAGAAGRLAGAPDEITVTHPGGPAAAVAVVVKGRFDPGQARDDHGRWTGHGGGGKKPRAPAPAPAEELGGNALWGSGQGVVADITPAERQAAARVWYSGRALETDATLRAGVEPFGQFGTDVASFTGLINRSPAFTQPALTYRGVQGDVALFGPPGTAAGKTFTDKGFASVSAKYDTALAYADAMLRVHIPPGVHALHADQGIWEAAGNPSYYTTDGVREYTLPPGRYTITADEPAMKDIGRPRTLDVTVLPPEPAPATARAAAGPEPEPAPEPGGPDLAGLPGGDRFAWREGDIEFDGDPEGG